MRLLRSLLALTLLATGCLHTPPPSEPALINNEQCAQELSRGNCKQAEIYCDLGLEFAPQYADLWTNKGLIAVCREDKKQAKEWFIKAIRYNQDQATAHLNLGKLYLDEDSDGRALDSFQRALKVNPHYLEARYNLGLAYYKLKKYDEAEKTFLTLLSIDPSVAQVHHDLGLVYYQQGDQPKAVEEMARAVQLAPGLNADWWNNLGTVLMEQSRFEEAAQSFSSCVALRQDNAPCQNNLDIALKKRALLDSAREGTR